MESARAGRSRQVARSRRRIAKVFPGSAGAGAVGLGGSFLAPGVAAVVLGTYAAVAVVTVAVLMARRDAT